MKRVLGTMVLSAALLTGCGMMHHDEHKETLAQADAPPAVLASFEKAYPGAKVNKVEKESYANGDIHYEINYTGNDGKKHEVEMDSNGKILEDH